VVSKYVKTHYSTDVEPSANRDLLKTDNFTHKDPTGCLTKYFCRVPFNEFHIYKDGFVSNCCFNWLPTEIGNIHTQTLHQILENEISKKIQASVRDGSYSYCNSTYCPSLQSLLTQGQVNWPLELNSEFANLHPKFLSQRIKIYLSFDYTCNLSCESCRNEKIYFDHKTAPPDLLKTYSRVAEQISELLEKGFFVEVNITGSGDAFASPLYYELMTNLPATENLALHISTNGTMMTEKKLNMPTKDQIRHIFISVDSCDPDRYAKIRRGGVFKHLETNLDALDQMVGRSQFRKLENWQLNVIVQRDNFFELGEFVDWAKRFKTLNSIFFTRILDWQHLAPAVFKQKAIWMKDHPEHEEFVAKMQDPRLRDSRVILGNLSEFLRN
jgi:MoaA/NifB/PqqE/SkfB family radical SAM enzyme